MGHELTGCVTLGSSEERCPPEGQAYVWVEFSVKNSEHYPTSDNGPQISILHQGQALPEMVFLPEGKTPRSVCTPDGYYRDEPCHFWVGAVLSEAVDTADLKVEARWHDQVAVWTLGGDEEVHVFSAPQFEWPTARREISGWAFHDPRNPTHAGIDIAAEVAQELVSFPVLVPDPETLPTGLELEGVDWQPNPEENTELVTLSYRDAENTMDLTIQQIDLGGRRTAPPSQPHEEIIVRGTTGYLLSFEHAEGQEPVALAWEENEVSVTVSASGLTREQTLRIVESMAPREGSAER